MEPKTSFTFDLSPGQQRALIETLQRGNYRPLDVPHTQIAVENESCKISLYKSGKCLVQGQGAQDFVLFVLEPEILQTPHLGYETLLDPDSARPHLGVDESGKGDFFGPLVTAAAYVDETLIEPLRSLGVRDSKSITSDRKAIEMAGAIQKLLGRRCTLVIIGPERYNELYSKMRSVNTMLAWAHARSIENLLAVVPDCPRAISDQFGNKQQVLRALMQRGRKIELVQRHRAESDMAVAAASVLARSGFLLALKKMKETWSQEFPKGASPAVIEAGALLVKTKGPKALLTTAKCHFRTTDVVLEKNGFSRTDLGSAGAAISKTIRTPFRRSSAAAKESSAE